MSWKLLITELSWLILQITIVITHILANSYILVVQPNMICYHLYKEYMIISVTLGITEIPSILNGIKMPIYLW